MGRRTGDGETEVRIGLIVEETRRLHVFAKKVDVLPPVGGAVPCASAEIRPLVVQEHGTTEEGVRFGLLGFASPGLVRRLGGPEALQTVLEGEGFVALGNHPLPYLN